MAAFDASRRYIRFTNDDRGRITAVQVPNIAARTAIAFARYTYDARGDLIRYTDADDLSIHYVYDDDHRIVRYSYDSGLTFHFIYDADGRCLETWGDYAGAPDPALAKHGDDDPAGHDRGDDHGQVHHGKHHRHGHDDGPNHT